MKRARLATACCILALSLLLPALALAQAKGDDEGLPPEPPDTPPPTDTALETTEGLLTRSREEARSSGYTLSDSLRIDGVADAAPTGRHGADGGVTIRLRKRYRAAEPAQVLSTKDLSLAAPIDVEVSGAGLLDIDVESEQEGVFFEVLVKRNGNLELLATIPVDVNGEMVLQGSAPQGTLTLGHNDYRRSHHLTTFLCSLRPYQAELHSDTLQTRYPNVVPQLHRRTAH